MNPGGFHGSHFRFRGIRPARNHRPGMAHAPPRRRRGASDEAHHRLIRLAGGEILPLQVFGGQDFGLPTNLANHDDGFGIGVGQEHLQHFDEIHALHRVAANANAAGLAKPGGGGFQPDFADGDWQRIRDEIYRGRGT